MFFIFFFIDEVEFFDSGSVFLIFCWKGLDSFGSMGSFGIKGKLRFFWF